MPPAALPAALASDISELIACPNCDALHHARIPAAGERAVCHRCGTILISPRSGAYLQILTLAVTVMILMTAALFLPFLELRVAGLQAKASVFDAVRAFADDGAAFLTVTMAALVVLIPVTRVLLLIYVLGPTVWRGRPPRSAAVAFRLSEDLKPWSMSEIFIIGVAVALVKVVDLARVELGPAFWLFGALVVVTVLQDGLMCRWSLWRTLETQR
jgi:paraquat-inducible protein A